MKCNVVRERSKLQTCLVHLHTYTVSPDSAFIVRLDWFNSSLNFILNSQALVEAKTKIAGVQFAVLALGDSNYVKSYWYDWYDWYDWFDGAHTHTRTHQMTPRRMHLK